MMLVDCIRSQVCGSCDPFSWASPEHLRMVFIASLIVSTAAAVFAAILSHPLTALPFICSSVASYVRSYLVERCLNYQQALESHGQVVRELTETQQAAQLALERSEQQVSERQRQNGVSLKNIVELEEKHRKYSQSTDLLLANLHKEDNEGKVQRAALSDHLQKLTQQNAQAEEIRMGLEKQIAEAESSKERLREEFTALEKLYMKQCVLGAESRIQLNGMRELSAQMYQMVPEVEATVNRFRATQNQAALTQQEMVEQSEKLLQLRQLIAEETGKG